MTDLDIRICIQNIIEDKHPKDENELEKLSDDLYTIIQDELYNYACDLVSSLNNVNGKENNMKFMIITTNGAYFIESEDYESVANEVYDSHTGYDNVVGIIKVE